MIHCTISTQTQDPTDAGGSWITLQLQSNTPMSPDQSHTPSSWPGPNHINTTNH